MRQAKHLQRELTDAERAGVVEARRLTKQEETQIRSQAKKYKQEYDAAQSALQHALQLLKAERLRQGLSLSDIQKRSAIERPNLSRLENDAEANPTVSTLTRYADALGKTLVITLADSPEE